MFCIACFAIFISIYNGEVDSLLSIAIVDDVRSEAEYLASFAKRYGQEYNERIEIAIFKSGFEFLDGYKAIYDAVFLDIEMPDMDGISTARKLRKFDENIIIIFVTNIAKYAIQGYSVGALDYLLKPPKYADIKMRMNVISKRKRLNDYSIIIPYQGGERRLVSGEIIYVESRGHDIIFHTDGDEIFWRGTTLKRVESELTEHGFYRCNNCYLVNLKYCTQIKDNSVIVNGEELQISRSRKKGFMIALVNALGG